MIIDEAQRMWSSEKIAFDHKTETINGKYVNRYYHDPKTVLINELSEPVMVLRDIYKSALDDRSEKTIIFLIGNGQEIYTGEELGENQIIHAVSSVSSLFRGKVSTKIYSSKRYDDIDAEIQDSSKSNSALYLKAEKRNRLSKNVGMLIDSVLDNTEMPKVERSPFIVTDEIDELYNRYLDIKEVNAEAKQRLFIDSYDQKKMNKIFNNSNRYAIDDTQLYDFFRGDRGAKLECFATEFNAQGLEVDYAYFNWTDRITRRGNRWVVNTKNVGSIYYYYKDIEDFRKKNPDIPMTAHNINDEIKKMIVNAYRVLLTRAEYKTIIYVKDEETKNYLKQKLCVNN